MFAFVCNSFPNLKCIVFFHKRTHRAIGNAQAAIYACRIRQSQSVSDTGVYSAPVCADCSDILNIPAYRYAPAALDATAVIPDQMRSGPIDFDLLIEQPEPLIIHTVLLTKQLQLAIAASLTFRTIKPMIRYKQLKSLFPGFDNSVTFCPNIHAWLYRRHTGSEQRLFTFNFTHANPA